MSERISTSFVNRDGVEKTVNFIRKVERTKTNKELIVCDHDDYEITLLPIDAAQRADRNTRVIFTAQIRNKKSPIRVNVPVVLITGGEHTGQIMIGRTGEYKKERALISHVARDVTGEIMVDNNDKPINYDDVTIPYSEYEIIRAIVDYNKEKQASADM